MPQTKVESVFFKNWVTIVVATVSIIQGLAFTELAKGFPEIVSHARAQGSLLVLSHSALCFFILLRIFQTYISAAADYDRWPASFFDLFVIFFLGALEYKIFSYIKPIDDFDIVGYHQWLCIIAGLALAAYVRVLFRLRRGIPSEANSGNGRSLQNERRLQIVNIAGILVSLIISIIVIYTNTTPHLRQTDVFYSGMVFAYSGVLILNMIYSIRNTSAIGGRLAMKKPPPRLDRKVFVVPATERVAMPSFHLFAENFSYFYEGLFGTSRNLTRDILRELFFVSKGSHRLGYRAFNVAIDETTGECVGLIMLDLGGPGGGLVDVLRVIRTMFSRVGFIGLLRTISNLRTLDKALPKVASDGLHINYIAVCKDRQRSGVGTELLGFARVMAMLNEKSVITADVREVNEEARHFFERHGFAGVILPGNRFDDLLGMGRIIRMKLCLDEDRQEISAPRSAGPGGRGPA